MTVLLRPADLTPEFHYEFLTCLRRALEEVAGREPALRVREWDFAIVDGVATVQVFLDKGHGPDGRPVGVLLDESMAIHKAWMESSLFERFADGVAIEIGSAGAVPLCRDAQDFVAQMGREVTLELWTPLDGKQKISGTIDAVGSEDGVVLLRVPESPEVVAVELCSVRRAQVDLLKPVGSTKGQRQKASPRK